VFLLPDRCHLPGLAASSQGRLRIYVDHASRQDTDCVSGGLEIVTASLACGGEESTLRGPSCCGSHEALLIFGRLRGYGPVCAGRPPKVEPGAGAGPAVPRSVSRSGAALI
jgi:hypothetical protein